MLHAQFGCRMKKQWIPSVVSVCLLIAVGVLWLRVHELERTVNSLRKQVPSAPLVIPIGTQKTEQSTKSERQNVFRLIDGAKQTEGTTHVGVPWSIEEGMLMDGASRVRTNMQYVPQPPVFKEGPQELIYRAPIDIEGQQFHINEAPAEPATETGTL
jgi:hypothetical protein